MGVRGSTWYLLSREEDGSSSSHVKQKDSGSFSFFFLKNSVSQGSYGSSLNVSELLQFAEAYVNQFRICEPGNGCRAKHIQGPWGDTGVGKQSQIDFT